ncbi:MAG: type IV secretory system conjugative DNA transfer family protein [Rhodobacteraceae bacterium]|nr:type IV secretory system conjugative DNA transfer family protein [Paracoccaceae bacterium]
MSKQQNAPDSPVARLLVTIAIGCGLWTWPLDSLYDPVLRGVWYFGAFCCAVGILKSLPARGDGGGLVGNLFRLIRAFGKDDSKGSAGFMSEREIRKVRLHRRKKGSRFAGIVGNTALWLWTETHHLIVGPAGSAKTSAAIINILMGSPESALINDIKGELLEMTARHRAKAFDHGIKVIDPKNPEASIKFNPLDDIVAAIEQGSAAALTKSRGIALQLAPNPQGGGGQNEIFYQGGRNLIVTVILAVCVALPPEHRNLATVYRALSDMDVLHDLLQAAAKSSALNGEIADMARSAHTQAFGDDGNAKTFESFRINAALALEGFGPGNYLAAITSETTFRFAELKERKISLYIKIDYANAKVLGGLSGLVQHLAAEAMVEAGNNKPVLFCLDEFTNAPCHKLAEILTLLRSAGVRVVMACQDLNDIERVYSKNDLETVLSEAHIKQFLSVRSKKTLEWLSAMLGEYTETVSSFAMGRDGAQESLARANRRLLTEDELRRLSPDAQIVLYGNHKPILAKKVQVFAISNWRKTVGINTAYGKKRKLLPVEVRLRWWGTEVTPRASRAYARIQRDLFRRRGQKGRFWRHLLGGLSVSPLLIIALIAVGLLQGQGLPNLRWEYGYRGAAHVQPRSYVWCRYVGPTSPGTINGPNCPLILWRK